MKKNYRNFFLYGIAFLFSLPFWILTSYAQKPFEGKVSYSIIYNNLPPEMEQMKSMLPSEIIIYIRGNMTRTEQSMGFAGSQVTIMDNKSESGTLLIDGMGGKFFIKLNKTDLDKMEKEDRDPKFTYVNESKKIAGYNCKRAEAKFEGMEERLAIYYTEEIPSDKSNKFKGLKGFPLEYETASEGMKMTISAKAVSPEVVSDALFQVPAGYKETTIEEFSKMMGGH